MPPPCTWPAAAPSERYSLTPEDFLATLPPHIQAIAVHLRRLVQSVLPDLEEIVFAGWNNLSYGTGDSHADKDLVCYIAPHTRSVNLGFYRGARLPDPQRLLGGTGKLLRHLKVTAVEQINDPDVLALLRIARQERLGGER